MDKSKMTAEELEASMTPEAVEVAKATYEHVKISLALSAELEDRHGRDMTVTEREFMLSTIRITKAVMLATMK